MDGEIEGYAGAAPEFELSTTTNYLDDTNRISLNFGILISNCAGKRPFS